MVRKLRLTFLALIIAVGLSACQALFIGIFPASAGQATARVDLSSTIASGQAGTFNLARVNTAGKEFLLLYSGVSFDPDQAHLVVMDNKLKVLATFTNTELPMPLSGGYAVSDVNGSVIIGNISFPVQTSGWNSPAISGVTISNPSVTGLPVYFLHNEANFFVSGGSLWWDEYNSAWGAPSSYSDPLGMSNLNLQNVLTERDSAGMPDVFIFQGNNDDTYLVPIPKPAIDMNALPTLIPGFTDIFSALGQYIVHKSNLDNSIGLSYGDVFAHDRDSQSLIHFTLSDPDSEDKLSIKWQDGMQLAAGAGPYCVVWDPTTRTLTRYDQWW